MNCKKRYLKQIETMNIYHQFIIYLQFLEQKGFSLDEKVHLEKHHILPFHAGGKKNSLYSIEILPQPSVKHLIEVIKRKNDKLKIKPFQESSLFYKVLKRQRKQAYGWKLVFVYL